MVIFKKILIVIFLGIFCDNCGGQGHIVSTEEAPQAISLPPPTPPVHGMQRTKVDFDTLPYNLANDNDPACKNRPYDHTLFELNTKFQNIGHLRDLPELDNWPQESLLVSDISGDSEGSFDFDKVGVGRLGDDLIIAWNGSLNQGVTFVWDIGFISSRQNTVQRVSKTYVTISGQSISIVTGGNSVALKGENSGIESDGQRHILRISLKYFENILAYPHWYVRGFALNGRRVIDSTSIGMFYSSLNPDYKLFVMTTCWLNLDSPYDMPILVLRDLKQISEEEESRHYERLFLKSMREFVEVYFLRSNFLPNLRSLNRIFYITNKEIHPITYENAVGFPIENEQIKDPDVYHGIVMNIDQLRGRLSSSPEHAAELIFIRAIGKSFLLQDAVSHIEFVEAFNLLVELKTNARRFGKRLWIDMIASYLSSNKDLAIRNTKKNKRDEDLIIKLMYLLEPHLTMIDIWKIWKEFNARLTQEGYKDEKIVLYSSLASYLDQNPPVTGIDLKMSGWTDSGKFHPLLDPDQVTDSDIDGLPDYFERLIGTNILKRDSDQDSWSDASEWILDKSPTNPLDHPTRVIADGVFGDWQKLLPRKIVTDNNRSGMCSGEGDINFFGGLAQKSYVMIGAVGAHLTQNSGIQWEIDLDFPSSNRRFVQTLHPDHGFGQLDLLEKMEGETGYSRKRVYDLTLGLNRSYDTLEISVESRHFGVGINFNEIETVRIRIRTTLLPNGQICDETAWFSPVASEGGGSQTDLAP